MANLPSPEATSKIGGQWCISASILNVDNSILGRIFFSEEGTLVYVAGGIEGGEDLMGHAVGNWLSEGPIVGFELNLFQYVPSAPEHTQAESHHFRGLARLPENGRTWTGEWYFCSVDQPQQPPRLVGKFQAMKISDQPLSQPLKFDEQGHISEEQKKKVFRKMDKNVEVPIAFDPRWSTHRVTSGEIGEVFLVPNFLEKKQVEEFESKIDRMVEFEIMNTRDTQEFGANERCACGKGLLREPLPQWQTTLVTALHNLGIFHPVLYPANNVRINRYAPGQGIHPHMDGPLYFPRCAMISLGSACVFDFYPRLGVDENFKGFAWDLEKEVPKGPDMPPDAKPAFSVILQPGSLLVFSGDAYIKHRHGIVASDGDEIGPHVRNAKDLGLSNGDVLKRERRISLTFRHLLPRCNCQSTGS